MKKKSIISYNVNGIRAAMKKGLADWIKENQFDIVLFQEIKANQDQIDVSVFEEMGYHHHWYSAEKKGYSGVGVLSKQAPDQVVYGNGIESHDKEGRTIRVDFGDITILNTYFPSGSSGDVRQAFKMEFLADYFDFINQLKKERPNIIQSGDYNICHKAIDIHDPVRNKKSSGFLPEEREWMDQFFDSGFIDTFRHFNEDPDHYSWWSYRANARANNKGWRIDYHAASSPLEKRLKGASILPDVKHSDHCPILMEIEM